MWQNALLTFALKRKIPAFDHCFPSAVHDVQVNIHVRPISLLKMVFQWIHTTVKLTNTVEGGNLIMNFSAVLSERIQLKFF